MVTRPADPQQVPRPGDVEIVAKVFGHDGGDVMLSADGGAPAVMRRDSGTALWRATVPFDAGIHDIVVSGGEDRDAIRILVRPASDIPRRPMPVAPGRDIHAIGAWPEHGIEGTQLGPNKNGRH